MARRKSRKTAARAEQPVRTARAGEGPAASPAAPQVTPAASPPASPAATPAQRPKAASGAKPASGSASAAVPDQVRGLAHCPEDAAGTPGMVRRSTCVAGMFLTLILGLYLGSLLPGMLQDLAANGHAAHGGQTNQGVATSPDAAREHAASSPTAATPAATAVSGVEKAGASPVSLPDALARRLAALEEEARKHPDSATTWAEIGNLRFDAGQVREAITAYERSLALAPGNADVLTDLGIMYREAGAPEKAVECFRKALAANPRHENALFNEGVVLQTDLGRTDEAAAAWRRLLEVNPQARTPDGRLVSDMIRQMK